MKLTRSTFWIAVYALAMVAGTVSAQAQDTAPAAEPAPAAEVAAPPAEPAPIEATTGAASTSVVTSQRPEASKEQAAAEPVAEEEVDTGLALSAFADAYYNFDWNLPPQTALGANGTQDHTAYVNSQGFGLAFLGLDASYSHDVVGMMASLRFGSGADRLIGQAGDSGLANIWQAYGTWTPTDELTIDFGQFATIYGAEVGESWLNLNYTRGALYYYMQPFWHTGVRLAYQATDQIAIKAMLTNGVNNGLATNEVWGPATRMPDVGLQLAYTGDSVSAYVGYYGNPVKPEGRGWSHFADLVLVGSFDALTVIFNGDLGVAGETADEMGETIDPQAYFGLSLAGGYAINDQFGVALRGEYLSAPEISDGVYFAPFGTSLITGTLTFEYKPEPHFSIRLDNRLELADQEIFITKDDTSSTYISSTLGVVVHTN